MEEVSILNQASDSGVEAAVSLDPTPMTDLLNEALTGEMLHPEHPGHEHTTLDDTPLAPEASSRPAESTESTSSDASAGVDETSDDRGDSQSRSRAGGSGEGKAKRQWVPPVWSRLPETGALLRGGPEGPDEVCFLKETFASVELCS